MRLVGLAGHSDEVVWQHAIDLGCVLVTKDEDFHRLSVLKGMPPKVAWIRVGNCTPRDVASLLRERWSLLREFASDPVGCITCIIVDCTRRLASPTADYASRWRSGARWSA